MNAGKVLLLGGSGFIGASVAEHLCARGIAVTVSTRVATRARDLLTLPTVEVVQADLAADDGARLDELMRGCDAAINLIGILHGDFEAVHVDLAGRVARAAARTGVRRFVHMSALNADAGAPSEYLRSRGRGEEAVRAALAGTATEFTVFRPSVVFGARDHLLNLFAALARHFPLIPLGSPDARLQPVWVEDVARAIVLSLYLPECANRIYALAGPRVYTLRELVSFAMNAVGHPRPLFGLGPALSALQAAVFERLPGKLITRDNVKSLRVPNVSVERFPAIFGQPREMESVMGPWLSARDGRVPGRLDHFRHRARHDHV